MQVRIAFALLAGVGCCVEAAVEPEPPDAELLEFLGSWEGEDGEWQEFFDSLPDLSEQSASDDEQNDQESGR